MMFIIQRDIIHVLCRGHL